jgi:hypothetical protein
MLIVVFRFPYNGVYTNQAFYGLALLKALY